MEGSAQGISAPPGPHGAPAHIMSVRTLVAIWGALVALTVVTVAAAQVDLGVLNLWVAIGIATVKAVLVLLFFMHLLYDRPFHAFVIFAALAFALLFIGLTLMDSAAYQPDQIPEYAPALNR